MAILANFCPKIGVSISFQWAEMSKYINQILHFLQYRSLCLFGFYSRTFKFSTYNLAARNGIKMPILKQKLHKIALVRESLS